MLNPRLCTSLPVFHSSTTRFVPVLSLPDWAENDSNLMLVGAVMVSVCVEALLFGLGSVWSALTVAVLVAIPGAAALVRMVTVTLAALAIVPSWQVTVPFASEQVLVGVTDINITFDGNGSVTITFVALAGPLFVTTMV